VSDVTERQRQELGAFLRARREQTSPEDVGLPGSPRRRTPGLRREELAMLAGISTTWYTFLEQGRDVRASRQVLGSVAAALRLDDAERRHLFAIAAELSPPVEEDRPLEPEVAQVVDLLGANPAYVTGHTFDLLAHNAAADEVLRGAADQQPRSNLVHWVFLCPEARTVLRDWTEVAQGLLARLRARAGRQPDEPAFGQIVDELRRGSVEADAWWPRYDIGTSGVGVKRVRMRDGREQRLAYTSYQVAERAGQTLTVYRRL
jgi:transcriptional regulator with XRE-family HTH domain